MPLETEDSMNESILTTIKKKLGISEEYEHFDQDIITDINSVLTILMQLGVGPEEGFSITGKDEVWSDFISDISKLELVKSYIYMKVRLMFDPPSSSAVIDVIKSLISESEWRLNVQVD